MKSNEFITESVGKERLAHWAQVIKRDCQQYIKEMKGKPFSKFALYRGMNDDVVFTTKEVRLDNRTPVDTAQDLHDMTNEYFVKNYGAPFRNAMFCTGMMGETERYGTPYIVFPVGKFEYVWSFKIDDLYTKIHYEMNRQETFGQSELNDLLDFGNYQTKRLNSASQEGTEVMIRCQEYHAINVHKITQDDLETLEKLIR